MTHIVACDFLWFTALYTLLLFTCILYLLTAVTVTDGIHVACNLIVSSKTNLALCRTRSYLTCVEGLQHCTRGLASIGTALRASDSTINMSLCHSSARLAAAINCQCLLTVLGWSFTPLAFVTELYNLTKAKVRRAAFCRWEGVTVAFSCSVLGRWARHAAHAQQECGALYCIYSSIFVLLYSFLIGPHHNNSSSQYQRIYPKTNIGFSQTSMKSTIGPERRPLAYLVYYDITVSPAWA